MRCAGVIVVIALLLSSTAAHAVSITNRDEQDHKVTVIEGDATADHVLKPSQTLNGICAKGCTIRLNDSEDDEYLLEANDVVSIEDGSLYYEGPDIRLSRRRLRRPVPGPPGRGKRPKSLAPAAWFQIGWQGVLYFVSIHRLN